MGDHHQVECGYCGQNEYVKGPFVLGIQTPASMQLALQWHHLAPPISRELFQSYKPCPVMDQWTAGPWEIVDKARQLIAKGTFEMADGHPVVDPSITGKVGGVDWDTRRVEQLATKENAASKNPGRSWHIGPPGGNVRVNLRRRDGAFDAAIIPLEDIHVIQAFRLRKGVVKPAAEHTLCGLG